VCIRFGQPMKKRAWLELSMAAMVGVGAPWPAMGISPEREGRGEWKGERGRSWGGGCHGGRGEGLLGGAQPLLLRAASLFGPLHADREVEENEEREKKKKEKNVEIIPNLKFFGRKIKDNL
jgi:hypothetical protein